MNLCFILSYFKKYHRPDENYQILFKDLMDWIRGKQEVEVVDLILRLREKLVSRVCSVSYSVV